MSELVTRTSFAFWGRRLISGFGSLLQLSMRGKAVVAVLGLLIYVLGLSGFVLLKKEALLEELQKIQRLTGAGQELREIRMLAFHSMLAVHEAEDAREPKKVLPQAGFDFQLIQSSYDAFVDQVGHNDNVSVALRSLLTGAASSLARGDAESYAAHLRQLVQMVGNGSLMVRRQVEERTMAYGRESDSLTGVAFAMGVLGVIFFGTVWGLFLTHLANDLNLLKGKAQEIVKGRRGKPLEVKRHDEVGQLMEAVNQMQSELARQEDELALERQKSVHREKMAAIGTLAAGIAHEIGNPITAISGVAQQMCAMQESHGCKTQWGDCHPQLILEQVDRIAKITREVSEFASARQAEAELLDLNQLVRNTVSLMRYDKRFSDIALSLELDHLLPAVKAVGDQLTQVVMNLLINAADALEDVEGSERRIVVASRVLPEGVELSVADNGKGMDEQTIERATEAFYTTKPVGKGTGLGLALCASVVEAHGGQLKIESRPGAGTTIRVTLPLENEGAARA